MNIEKKIEEILKNDEGFQFPLVAHGLSPSSRVYVGNKCYHQGTSDGFRTKKEALDKRNKRTWKNFVVVRWKAPNRKTSRYYIYFRTPNFDKKLER